MNQTAKVSELEEVNTKSPPYEHGGVTFNPLESRPTHPEAER